MRKLKASREIATVRSVAGQALSCRDIHLSVDSTRREGLEIRFATPGERFEDLERLATAIQAEVAARLPTAPRSPLAVEVGVVRSTLSGAGGETEADSRRYAMASWRGVILGIGEPDGAAAFSTPWSDTVDAAQIDPTLPVALGPSAVLTLISYALEVSGSHTETETFARMPGLTVTDTASSPYPPQHYPFGVDGAFSPDLDLLSEGEWCDRQESVGGGVDPIFFLLTRPERSLRPLAASSHFARRNLAIRCDVKAELVFPHILVDSFKVRVGPRGGVVPVDAEVSVVDPRSAHSAGVDPLRLNFDPWWVLGRIQGAWGPRLPAVDEDPIEGDAHGLAPSLAVDLTLAELL